MSEMLFQKIIERMKNKGCISPKAFEREIAYVRFDKYDSRKIIEDMRKRGMLKLDGTMRDGKITIIIPGPSVKKRRG
jgi:hypothetical protein